MTICIKSMYKIISCQISDLIMIIYNNKSLVFLDKFDTSNIFLNIFNFKKNLIAKNLRLFNMQICLTLILYNLDLDTLQLYKTRFCNLNFLS